MEGNTQVYELGYLLLPSITEDQLEGAEDALKKAVSAAGGTEIASESPEKIDLAYTMTKTVGVSRYVVNDAYIGWVKFEAEPSAAAGVKEAVSKMEEVLRFLLIKAPRESDFTFAKAREALIAKEVPEVPNGEAKAAGVE
ncbi:30S ribosomal protein S6 [Candidatus Parcubacteria bacterium]|nr:30S ribosomal protein S6 [Candidatus Parcubacteria bacterium]